MTKIKRSFDLLTDEKRRQAIDEIIGYFSRERNEQIGVIAAEGILDFILETVANDIYNKGVDDSIAFVKEKLENLEPDMAAILKKQS